MRSWSEILLDEKIVLCTMSIVFAGVTVLLIHWNTEKEYVTLFGGFISGLIGALLRGIPGQSQPTDGSKTTIVPPKP